MKKFSLIAFLYFGVLSMLIMSMHYFQGPNTGILKAKAAASSSLYLTIFYTHITGGLIGISIGPFQFIKRLRHRFSTAHKTIGMIYLIAIFSSGLAGLYIAPFAMGGPSAQLGFFLLAIVWLATTAQSVRQLWMGKYQAHGQWMIRSYALTFAAIPQRLMLLIPLFTSTEFLPIYRLSAWLPWIFQLLIAEAIIRSYTSSRVLDGEPSGYS